MTSLGNGISFSRKQITAPDPTLSDNAPRALKLLVAAREGIAVFSLLSDTKYCFVPAKNQFLADPHLDKINLLFL